MHAQPPSPGLTIMVISAGTWLCLMVRSPKTEAQLRPDSVGVAEAACPVSKGHRQASGGGGVAVELQQGRHTQACNLQGGCQRVCPWHREGSDHPTAPVPTQEQPGQHQPHHPPTPSLQMESTPFESCLNLSMSPVAPLPTP